MTRYDDVFGHPLAGVPQRVLDVARAAVAQAPDADMRDVDDAHALADAVVATLHQEHMVCWPTRVPSRDDLVLALMLTKDEFDRGETNADSLLTHLVDDLVYPLLRTPALASPNTVTNRVDGTVTGSVVQANQIEGGVHG